MGFGLFSGKTVVSVNVSTVPINETIPENRLSNLLMAGSKQNKRIANTLLLHNLTSYKNMLNQFYAYGNSGYTYGLPESNLANNKYNLSAVNTVLEGLFGPNITTIESFLYRPTIAVWGRWWLQENEGGYDYTANTLLIDSTTWDVVGFSENVDKTEITVLLEDGSNTSTYGPITDYYVNEIYYCAEYHFDSAPTVDYTWLYQPSLGTHVTLNVTNTFDTTDLFPIVPLRTDSVNINADKTSTVYSTSRQVLSRVKMDINALTNSVTKQVNDDGTLRDTDDLENVSDIFLLFGLNIYGQTLLEKQTAYLIFNSLEGLARISEATYVAAVAADGEIPTNTFLVDSATFNYEVVFNYITASTIAGRIGNKGESKISFSINVNTSTTGGTRLINDYIVIKHQITSSSYVNLLVHGLYLTHTLKTDRGERIAEIFLDSFNEGDSLSANQKNFIIPLSKNYLNTLTTIEADTLISRTTHLVVYASDSQYIEWYKTSAFTSLLNITLRVVAVVMLFWDFSGTTSEALYLLGELLVYQYALELVLTLLFETFADSSDKTKAAVIILAAVITYKITPSMADLSSADVLLKSVNALSQSTAVFTQVEMAGLIEDYKTFLASADEVQDEITAANRLLEVDPSNILTSMDATISSEFEQPEDFFTRTLNTTPGQLTFDQLHSYVDNNLNLRYI